MVPQRFFLICAVVFGLLTEPAWAQALPEIPPPPPPTEEPAPPQPEAAPGPDARPEPEEKPEGAAPPKSETGSPPPPKSQAETGTPPAPKSEAATGQPPAGSPPAASKTAPGAAPTGARTPSSETKPAPKAAPQLETSIQTPKKERGLASAPTLSGESGLLRVASADGSEPGLVRVGLGIEFFTLGSFIESGDENTRFAGILSLSGSPVDYMELWMNIRAISNNNELTDPELLQSQGDLQFGIKGYYPVDKLLSVGADAQLSLLSGIGEAGYDFGASEVRLRALFTSDFRNWRKDAPVRLHANAGIIIDNSAELLSDDQEFTNAERFALGVSDFNRIAVGFGVEVPFSVVTPYLEYSAEFPLDYTATPGIVVDGSNRSGGTAGLSNDAARPAYGRVVPQRLTPGVRVNPVDGFSIDLAVEIGLTPEETVGVPVVPDYQVVSFVSYAIDPTPAPPPPPAPVFVEVENPTVEGVVIDNATQEPIQDAIVIFDGAMPVATSEDGRFLSGALPEGPVTLSVRRAGYVGDTAELLVASSGNVGVEIFLDPEVVASTLSGTVVDESGAPVQGAVVFALSGDGADRKFTSAEGGRFSGEIGEGVWRLVVSADGYLRTGRQVIVQTDQVLPGVALQLTPRGEQGARVDGDRIVLPVQPMYAKGEIEPNVSARRGLDLVADLLLADPGIRIEVSGHTDSRGDEEANQEVSTQRAKAARTYLLERGVLPNQLVAQGYGGTRPVAPNLTRAGRERNRRVEFMVP